MPVYDYKCKNCNKEFELVLTFAEREQLVTCPHCGSTDVEQEATKFYAVTSSKS
jgi:putative FmdB family regulatory protein